MGGGSVQTGEYLKLLSLQVGETETRLECLLNNNKNSDFCAPLTSFDWNEVDPYLLGEGFEISLKQRKI